MVGAGRKSPVRKNLSNNWKEAIRNYSAAISWGFVEDFVFTARGRAKYELKDYQAAVKDFTTAIEIDATHAEAYKWRGETYCELNDFEKARDDFQTYLDFDGKNLDEETRAVYKDKIDKCEKAIHNNDPIEKLGIAKPILGLFIFFILCYCLESAWSDIQAENAVSRIQSVVGGVVCTVVAVSAAMLTLAVLISGAEGVSWIIENLILAAGAFIMLNEDLKIAKQNLGWSVPDGIINLTQGFSEMFTKPISLFFDVVLRRKV